MSSAPNIRVVKRGGDRIEDFDPAKLANSIAAACRSVGLPDGVATDTAEHVLKNIAAWLGNKSEVTSADLRRIATRTLTTVSPEAGYLYKHHHTMV